MKRIEINTSIPPNEARVTQIQCYIRQHSSKFLILLFLNPRNPKLSQESVRKDIKAIDRDEGRW